MRLGWILFVLPLAFGVGCAEDRTQNARGELVFPDELHFPRTFIGYPRTLPLVVENRGIAGTRVELELPYPFQAEFRIWRLDAGPRPLPIVFAPEHAGLVEQVARLREEGGTDEDWKEVKLVGLAEVAPPCAPSAPCREVEFDPDTGKCTEKTSADGAACVSGDLCRMNERCLQGACLGEAMVCDDDNLCTVDSCDPAQGCVYTERTCPAATEPCKVADCDPTVGCGFSDAPPLTPCGTSNCSGANVCNEGKCVLVDVPDGHPCTDECGEGKCRNKSCERAAGDVLKHLWTYDPPAEIEVLDAVVIDGAGNGVWVECRKDRSECLLVSRTLTGGNQRWAERLDSTFVERRGLLVAGDLVLVAGAPGGEVEAKTTLKGEALWSLDARAEAERGMPVGECPCTLESVALTRGRDGEIVLSASVVPRLETEPTHTLLLGLREQTGELSFSSLTASLLVAPPLSDPSGDLYLAFEDESGRWVASMRGKATRWQEELDEDAPPPVALFDDRLFHSPLVQWSAQDGSVLPALDLGAADVLAPPLLGRQFGWLLTDDEDELRLRRIEARDFADEGWTTLLPVDGSRTSLSTAEPLLLRNDEALVAASFQDGAGMNHVLWAVDVEGELDKVCRFPESGVLEGSMVFRSGRLIVRRREGDVIRLRAYELPGRDLGASGWVQALGDPRGGGRAR